MAMRRLVLPLLGSVLLAVSACGTSTGTSASSSSTAATTAASMADQMTDHMTESMTTQPMMTDHMTESMMTGSMTGAPSPAGTTITTGASDFGTILFDGNHQAIYLFDKETSGTADCYGECAAAWPPVLTTGSASPAGQVDSSLLGTTTRTDGTTQVTYGGHPLYYYAHEGPGEVTCHNANEFGGLWLVVTPAGSAAPA